MNTYKKLELDNLFSRNRLGEVCLENPSTSDMWQTEAQNYVTIRVPYSMRDRFNVFQVIAASVMGEDFEAFHVQKGTPLSDDFYIDETWYFIPCKTAMKIHDHFETILPGILPGGRYS